MSGAGSGPFAARRPPPAARPRAVPNYAAGPLVHIRLADSERCRANTFGTWRQVPDRGKIRERGAQPCLQLRSGGRLE
eukprot:1184919-Pleurochrysis_carterae.AAC.1